MPGGLSIGVDLGGTKIEAIALRTSADRASFDVLARRRVPTRRERGYEAILEETAALVEAIAAEAGLDPKSAPVGVGMPGGVTRAGLVKNSNTVCLELYASAVE
ncbi:MAG TPA: ROK family protein, partial [Candidatus Nanopelagicales bacterium]|nr:ROK family protein [Candidatus Nanopelagicales bacterium]